MTTPAPTARARREAEQVGRQATRAQAKTERTAAAAIRTGKPDSEVTKADRVVQRALENPPTLATAIAGLVVALGTWGITELPASVPAAVTVALGGVVVALAGIIGKVAQRFTYDRATMDVSVANFVDDLHALGGTPQAEHRDVDPDPEG